jgi:hypothetical protein
LIFAILPLVNLPFDFFSLGLTRALLRWTCQPGAPSPFWVGLLDTVIAVLLMIPLAAVLVLSVQAADAVVFWQSGQSFVVLPRLLDRIGIAPWDVQNFWVYFLMASTLIPSLLNACVGTLSLMVTLLPPVRFWVLANLEAANAREEGWNGYGATRFWVVTACVGHVVGSFILTVAAVLGFGWLAITVVPDLLPWLLTGARWLAAISGRWFGLPPAY